MKLYLLIVLLIPCIVAAQLTNRRGYVHCLGPGESCLCNDIYRFYDSVYFNSNGCEHHPKVLGAAWYRRDSSGIVPQPISYNDFIPANRIIKKYIPGKTGITVRVYDIEGMPIPAHIFVLKLRGRGKRDKILLDKTSYGYDQPVQFTVKPRRLVFWTLAGIYPLFETTLQFSSEERFNYYEIHLNLPGFCVFKTENTSWGEWPEPVKIIDDNSLLRRGWIYKQDPTR